MEVDVAGTPRPLTRASDVEQNEFKAGENQPDMSRLLDSRPQHFDKLTGFGLKHSAGLDVDV